MISFEHFKLRREYLVEDDSTINEMANVGKETSKLPCVLYVSDNRCVSHGPRIKVNTEYSNKWSGSSFTVTVDTNPKVIGDTHKIKPTDVETIIDWVILNREPLLQYWKQEIDISKFLNSISHV